MNSLFERAKKVIPGGVNSPVRAFNSVGGEPIFVKSAKGSKIYDTNNKEYIDYVCSWGPMILGHNDDCILKAVEDSAKNGLSFGAPTQIEVEMAELVVSLIPNIEKVRMVNSGTEGVMSALRLAKGYTKKSKIIKFEGCYHGHCDSMLISAGSGAVNIAGSLGVDEAILGNTLIAKYNDIASIEKLIKANDVAGIIIEPVAANMGVVPPSKNFLQDVRKLCTKNDILLIFDEVITGFRLAKGGAQEYFGITADIVVLGKILGGGMPVGAYGASAKIMDNIAPLGSVYQAGTLSGNPVAMSAGHAQLKYLNENKEVYTQISKYGEMLKQGFEDTIKRLDLPMWVNREGSLLSVFFTPTPVVDFATAKTSKVEQYAIFFHKMLNKGINLAPAQFEAMFVSYAHTSKDIEETLQKAKEALTEMKTEGVFER